MIRVIYLAFVFQLLLSPSQSQQPSDEGNKPPNFTCTEVKSHSVELSWNGPKNQSRANVTLTEYRVRVYVSKQEKWSFTYRTGLNDTTLRVSCLQPNSSYRFQLIPIYKEDERTEKISANVTVQTLPDPEDPVLSLPSVLENWEAMLAGAAFMLLFILLICSVVFVACRYCISRKTGKLPSRDDSVLQGRMWQESGRDSMGERPYSDDPTISKVSPPHTPKSIVPPSAAAIISARPNTEPEAPRVPSWPGSICISQNLEELQDHDIYQNEMFTGPTDDEEPPDLPVYSNEAFDGQGGTRRCQRRVHPNLADLPIYGNCRL